MLARFLVPTMIALAAGQAFAAPGGALRTLPRGFYDCADPGLAGNQAVTPREDMDFEVVNGSSYLRDNQRGTYLHTGTSVVFTSGNLRGAKFERVSQTMLRERLQDGALGPLRCVKRGS